MQVLYYTSQLKLLSDHANESVWNHSSVNLKVNHQVGIVCTEHSVILTWSGSNVVGIWAHT